MNTNLKPLCERQNRLAKDIDLLKIRDGIFSYGWTTEFIRGDNGQNIAAGEPVFMTQPLNGTSNIMIRVTPLTLGDPLIPVIIKGKFTDVAHLINFEGTGLCSEAGGMSFYDTMLQALEKPITVTCEVRYSDEPSTTHTQEIQIGLGAFERDYEVHNTFPSWAVLLDHLEDQVTPDIYSFDGMQVLKVELPAGLVEQYDATHLYAKWIEETEAFVKQDVLYTNEHRDSGDAYAHMLAEGIWEHRNISEKVKEFIGGYATALNSTVISILGDDTSEFWDAIDMEVIDNHEMTAIAPSDFNGEQTAKAFNTSTMLELHEYTNEEVHISWQNCFTGQQDYDYLNKATSVDMEVAIDVVEGDMYLSDCMESDGYLLSSNASNWIASLEHETVTEIIERVLKDVQDNHDIEDGDRLMSLGELTESFSLSPDKARRLVMRQQEVFGSSITYETVIDAHNCGYAHTGILL